MRRSIIAIAVGLALSACGSSTTSDGGPAAPSASATPSSSKAPATKAPATKAPSTKAPSTKAPAPKPAGKKLTVAQENAKRSAESYLEMQGFSRSGLIKQLEFEGFSANDATVAIDTLKVDWNQEAAESAKSYTDMQGFSRSGLIEQLMFEGFTKAQAEHGADSVGL